MNFLFIFFIYIFFCYERSRQFCWAKFCFKDCYVFRANKTSAKKQNKTKINFDFKFDYVSYNYYLVNKYLLHK